MTEYIFREVHYGYTDGTALGRTLEKQEEIVRCRDCREYNPELYRHISCELLGRYVEPDDFCSWSCRRSDKE